MRFYFIYTVLYFSSNSEFTLFILYCISVPTQSSRYLYCTVFQFQLRVHVIYTVVYFSSNSEDESYLPSQQTVQYYLVRLQGLAALLSYIFIHSLTTFKYPFIASLLKTLFHNQIYQKTIILLLFTA